MKLRTLPDCLSEELRLQPPATVEALRGWLLAFAGLRMPMHAVCPDHCSPLEYLAHSFLEENGDRVVWACRGGGKTMLGAAATLLDLLFKPGIQIRILGGSLEQSDRMYDYLRRLFETNFADQLAAPPTRRGLTLHNGSRVEILAQSDRSVRGQRVQKLRCDEVELFDPQVWAAAQLVTKSMGCKPPRAAHNASGFCEPVHVRGAIEAFSTMHRPGGFMQEIIATAGSGREIFSWCIWDVIEKCPVQRECCACPLAETCGGRARFADGFVPIDDVIAMRARVGRALWDREMLCLPPRFSDAVFAGFTREKHVRPWHIQSAAACEAAIAGIDFGIAGAFVCLWIAITRDTTARPVAHVVDEAVLQHLALDKNIAIIQERERSALLGRPLDLLYCDVAGRQINSHSGKTNLTMLHEAGFTVRARPMGVQDGLDFIEALLDPAAGAPRLYIDPRCQRLIAALEGYRRARDGGPIKDGTHDHLIDALRYGLVNHLAERPRTQIRSY